VTEFYWSDDTENVCKCGNPVRHYHGDLGLCNDCEDDYIDLSVENDKEDMFTELFE